jgi:hypothetical protein
MRGAVAGVVLFLVGLCLVYASGLAHWLDTVGHSTAFAAGAACGLMTLGGLMVGAAVQRWTDGR